MPLIGDAEGDENDAPGQINPGDLLPAGDSAFEFKGSLTTPPCTPGLEWIVYNQPITMSADQLDALRAAYSHNIRPIRPVDGRPITVGQVASDGRRRLRSMTWVPREPELEIEELDHGVLQIRDGEKPVAKTKPRQLENAVPELVGTNAAPAVKGRCRGTADSEFSNCFVCGSDRDDALG